MNFDMKKSQSLHECHVSIPAIFISRAHGIFHSIAIAFLVYYRVSFLFRDQEVTTTPLLLWVLVFLAELILSFVWLLGLAYNWRPVSRTVFPERLPHDDHLPAIDVFICTADPKKEPILEVMNTVLSAMALDYPAEKLHVYVSDDADADITLCGMREAWRFAKFWIPFCNKFGIRTTCPGAFLSTSEDYRGGDEFVAEREMIQEKYEKFKECLAKLEEELDWKKAIAVNSKDHPSVIEVMQNYPEEMNQEQIKIPLLVYVSREKKTSNPHHFKAGALNVLLRVSGVISNSPYILVLDCDMYCNDSSSARQAMCFHFDPEVSSSLAFVQFPQKYRNISDNDIYASQLRSTWQVLWPGMDGLNGPVLSGTGFYITRKSLYGDFMQKGTDISVCSESAGNSQLEKTTSAHKGGLSSSLLQETRSLASSSYEKHTKWGEEVGFLYLSVAEDFFTGFILHCKGWRSIYLNPSRPQFLGVSVTNLNDLFIQGIRWSSGIVEVGLSKFCPLIYTTSRISFLQSMCYAEIAFFPLCYCLSLWCFATVPQLCLLNGIALYPQVSSPYFAVFSFIFLSATIKQIYEIYTTGGSIKTWRNEQRIWMMKSITIHTYGSLDAILKTLRIRTASFQPTNKADDSDKSKLYRMGKFDFQASAMCLVPMVSVVILNMTCLVTGVLRIVKEGIWEKLFVQVWVSFYVVLMNYAIVEGMVIRKDEKGIPLSVTLLSSFLSVVFLFLGSMWFVY